jgi:hypothetical protein
MRWGSASGEFSLLCDTENGGCSNEEEKGKVGSCADVGGPLLLEGKPRSEELLARCGDAAEPDRLRDPSNAEASEEEPITYAGTMPFIAGEET